MASSIRSRLITGALALSSIALAASSADAGATLHATDGQTLYSIDTQSFAVTQVGPMPLLTGSGAELAHGSLESDASGTLWSMSNKAFYRVDPATGQTTLVGPFNVSFVFEGGLALHPTTGNAYGTNLGSAAVAQLMQIDTTTGKGTALGLFPGAATHDFNGLAFDASGQLYGVDAPSNSLWKIDHLNPAGAGTHPVGAGLGAGIQLGFTGGLTYDATSNQLWGYASGTHALFTVDPSSGVATLQHSFPATVPTLTAISLESCSSTVQYGAGCAGSGGFVPTLDLLPCPAQTGQPVQLVIDDALGGTYGLLVFGLGQGFTPMDSGCALLVQPLLTPILTLPLGGAGAGNGSLILSSALPAGLPTPFSFTMQFFTADSGGAASFANSAGLEVSVDS